MNTEISKITDINWLRGWVLYDGDCPFCCALAARFEKILTCRGFDLAPLQAPWVQECLGLSLDEPLREMRVLTVNGEDFGGAEALTYLARRIWWAWPLCALALLPGGKRLLRSAYGWIATRRNCLAGDCDIRRLGRSARLAFTGKSDCTMAHEFPAISGLLNCCLFRPVVWLKRHPIPVVARFHHSLVLTYALPQEVLEPLLPPGLSLDTFKGLGFVAIALVQTQALRPAFLPGWTGQDFFLTGYRIFARYKTRAGRTLRGLHILRSDTDHRLMAFFGNRLTHYNYRVADVNFHQVLERLEIEINTPRAEADLHVIADLDGRPAPIPAGSPFANLREARLFAGPLPFTFDYEPETHSIVMIEGVRENWKPQPIRVDVLKNTFFDRPPFNRVRPMLANAFHVQNISYRWRRGVREALPPNDAWNE